MTRRFRVGLAVIVFLSALVTVQAAWAHKSEDSARSLTGETLLASELGDPGTSTVSGTCNPLSTSTFTFSVSGAAVGPYPGAFTENGTLTFGPFGVPGVGFAPVSFESTFTIMSPAGTVRGTKTLSGVTATGFGACGEFAFEGGDADAVHFEGAVAYTARITTTGGATTDTGESFVSYQDTKVRGVAGFNGFNFVETFTSTSGVDDGDDDDDDGDDGDD